MREAQLLQHLDLVSAPDANGCSCPFADPIDGHDGSFFEWRRVESASRVRLMMLGKKDRAIAAKAGQFLLNGFAQVQLLSQPGGKNGRKGAPPPRCHREVGFQHSSEL